MTIITKAAGRPVIGLLAILGVAAYILTGCPDSGGDSSPSPTVTRVTVTAAGGLTVAKGGTLQFSAKVEGTNNPAQTVTWSVSGGVSGTGISAEGLLTAAEGETAQTLTVTATSTADTAKSGRAAVAVSGGTVTITVDETTVAPGGTLEFEASPADVTWTLTGSKSDETEIDEDGVLTVGADETAKTLTITATSTAGKSKSVKITVSTVTVSISVTPQNRTVAPGGTLQFTASPAAVTWSVSGGVPGTGISTAGLLTVGADETAQTLTVTATSTADPTKKGTATVTVSSAGPGSSVTTYDITYVMHGGTAIASDTYSYGTAKTLPTTATKTGGYNFAGWYTNAEYTGDRVTQVSATETGNKTFHAKWTEIGSSGIAYYWVNEQDNLRLSVQSFSLSNGASLTIAPQSSGYSDHQWYVNGEEVTTPSPPTESFTFSAQGRDGNAQYTIGLVVKKGVQYYHTEIQIMVTN